MGAYLGRKSFQFLNDLDKVPQLALDWRLEIRNTVITDVLDKCEH